MIRSYLLILGKALRTSTATASNTSQPLSISQEPDKAKGTDYLDIRFEIISWNTLKQVKIKKEKVEKKNKAKKEPRVKHINSKCSPKNKKVECAPRPPPTETWWPIFSVTDKDQLLADSPVAPPVDSTDPTANGNQQLT